MDQQAVVDLVAAADAVLVLCDYDGTLAPIVVDPDAAVPLPEAAPMLRELVGAGVAVAVVSGRPVEFLLRHLSVDGVELVGQYGLERAVDGRPIADPRAEPFAAAVCAAGDELERALPGRSIERKAAIAVVAHWRADGDITSDEISVIDHIARRHGLEIHEARMARELRVPVDVDKGDAVETLVGERSPSLVVFAGDDRGDLAAFRALDRAVERGAVDAALKLGVLSPEAPSALVETADVLVDGPAALVSVLTAVARARRAR